MSILYLVRHGQTDLSRGGDDKLTPKGWIQCEGLGRYWLDHDVRPEHVFVGPRRRHRESADAAAVGARERGASWPDPVVIDELDEYPAGSVIRHALEQGDGLDPGLRHAARGFLDGDAGTAGDFERMFRSVTRAWVRGETSPPDTESFAAFRERVGRGMQRLVEQVPEGASAAVFTSAGPISAVIGQALALEHERTLELSWNLRNSATSEMLVRDAALSLNTFNGIEHLSDRVLITLR